MANGDKSKGNSGGKHAPPLVYEVFVDAERCAVPSKDVPVVLRPRDVVRWVAQSKFEIKFVGRSARARAAQALLKPKESKGRFSIEFSDPSATKLTRLDYEVLVDGRIIDPTIIVDPAAVVLLA